MPCVKSLNYLKEVSYEFQQVKIHCPIYVPYSYQNWEVNSTNVHEGRCYPFPWPAEILAAHKNSILASSTFSTHKACSPVSFLEGLDGLIGFDLASSKLTLVLLVVYAPEEENYVFQYAPHLILSFLSSVRSYTSQVPICSEFPPGLHLGGCF